MKAFFSCSIIFLTLAWYCNTIQTRDFFTCFCGLLILGMVNKFISENRIFERFWTSILQFKFNTTIRILGASFYRKIQVHSKNVAEDQEIMLQSILTKNDCTIYGKNNHFHRITNRRDFQTQHSLTSYKDYVKYIERIAKGERNILTRDDVVFLSTSSGTTGFNKLFPNTQFLTKTVFTAYNLLTYYVLDKKVGLNISPWLVISYKPKIDQTSCGIPIAPVSRHIFRHIPWTVSPIPVFEIEDEQSALHVHAFFAIQNEQITQIAPFMATIMYSFCLYLQNNWIKLCTEIEMGKIGPLTSISEEHLHRINNFAEPNQSRALTLRKEFKKGIKGIGIRIWPHCKCLRMITSGSFSNYAKAINDIYFPGVFQYSPGHASSEGFLGININPHSAQVSYLALTFLNVMEFIPEEAIDEENPPTVFPECVEFGKLYEIVITTHMGLYRYRTGDVVKITHFYNQCPRYEFQYRTGQLLNLYWEKTPENVFYDAIQHAAEILKLNIKDYTATESVNIDDFSQEHSVKNYVLFIEIDGHLNESEKLQFDLSLCEKMELYKILRDKRSIASMNVIQVKYGTFSVLRQILVSKSGNKQVKIPRAMKNPDILSLLLKNQVK